MISNKRFSLGLVFLIFGLVYCLISLVNHYNFRTYGLDLGISNNAIFDYAHFRWNDCPVMQPQFDNVLSDHFTLLPILVSPLYWIFGSYTMLIFQIGAVLYGGLGIFRYFNFKTGNQDFSLLACIHFFSVWGIYSALSFDYHDNVIGAMLVPWFILYFEKRQWKFCSLFFILICISKENMALWAVFISIGLVLLNRQDKYTVKTGLLYSLIAIVYFMVIVKVIIPELSNAGRDYRHFNYSALGSNFGEAISKMITNPLYCLKLIFINNTTERECDGIKAELHFMILVAGGWVMLMRPAYIAMLIPIYAQKLFSDDYGKWGINSHYSVEFAPILTIALFNWLSTVNEKIKIRLGVLFCAITMLATIAKMDKRVARWYNAENLRIYQGLHYKTDYNVRDINLRLKLIPDDARVCASNQLVPHLAFREYIYIFPEIVDANYVIILRNGMSYPLSPEGLKEKTNELKTNGEWEVIVETNDILILKKTMTMKVY
jgi:uncharacterized membrane protein